MIKHLLKIYLISVLLLSNIAIAEEFYEVPQEVAVEQVVACPTCHVPFGLIADKHFSEITGAALMTSGLRTYQMADDWLIPSTAGDTSACMILGRFGKLVLENFLLDSYLMVAQHEVFGHGARGREFGLSGLKYNVTPFSGATYFNNTQLLQLSLSEQIAFSAGGIEGDGILAKYLRDQWLNSKCMDTREANLYYRTSLDQTFYILNTKYYEKHSSFPAGHDIKEYIVDVNRWYGSAVLTTQKLRKQALMDFFDPFFFYSLFSMGDYVIEGNQAFEYPMIPIGAYCYLPALRLSLTPFGPEYQFLNFVKGIDNVIQATLRYGHTGFKRSYGLAVEATRLWTSDLLTFDGKVDIWNQPKLFTSNAASAPNRFGGAISCIARYRLMDQLDLMGQIGYKTSGYMPGEFLKASPILRVGFYLGV